MSIAPSDEAKRTYAANRAEVKHLQARVATVTAERDMYQTMIRIALQGTQAGTYIAQLEAERTALRAALATLIGWQPKDENGNCYYCERTFEDYDGPRDPHAADCPMVLGRAALQEPV